MNIKKSPKFIGIIPARAGSKGIPSKNIVNLCGNPLIYYTIKSALNSNLDKVVVSTDCLQIAEVSQKLGCPVILRPKKLAEDKTPTLPVLLHALEKESKDFDYVVTLQPTSPLRSSVHINESIKRITDDKKADSLVSTVPVPHNMVPESIMKMQKGYLVPYTESNITRRQDKPSYFARNGAAIYISKIQSLHNGIMGERILPYEMDYDSSIDVDFVDDLKRAELIMKNKL